MNSITVAKARDFSRPQDYDAFSVIRLYNAHLRILGGRHAWVRLSCNGRNLYRRIRGAGGGTGLPSDGMELDYDSRLELGINSPRDADGFHPCNVIITPAGLLGSIRAHWRHPSIEYRVPYRLAMLSVALGLLGAVLGAASFVR